MVCGWFVFHQQATPFRPKEKPLPFAGQGFSIHSGEVAEAQPASACFSERLRAFGSSSFLRRRMDFGVTSTSSSSWM